MTCVHSKFRLIAMLAITALMASSRVTGILPSALARVPSSCWSHGTASCARMVGYQYSTFRAMQDKNNTDKLNRENDGAKSKPQRRRFLSSWLSSSSSSSDGAVSSNEIAKLQPIVGYFQDEEQHWVAKLRCGHSQHVRHDPPMTERPWVTTKEGRDKMLGVELQCKLCVREMKTKVDGLDGNRGGGDTLRT